jgi:hypothetical protein
VATGELGDHQCRASRIDLEQLARGRRRQGLERPTESIPLGRLERVLAPARRVVDQDLDRPEGRLRRIEQPGRRRWIAEIRLDGSTRPPASRIERMTSDASRARFVRYASGTPSSAGSSTRR